MSQGKRALIIFGAIVAIVLVVVISLKSQQRDAIEVQTSEVTRMPTLVATVNASGEIKPKEFVELQAEISGVIKELFVQEGDFVQKGELLLRIDTTQNEAETRAQRALLETGLMDASNQEAQIALQETTLGRERANVRASEAELARARQAKELAQNNFTRKQNLFEEDLISRDLYEAARNELVAAEQAVVSADARLEQAKASLAVAEVVLTQTRNSYKSSLSRVEQFRANLSRAEDSLSKTSIRSPLTGVITQLNVEVGERAVPGTLNNPAATIMIIADLSVIEAEIEVDETDIVNVELGQEAIVTVDALPDSPMDGKVTEIGNSAIQTAASSQEAKDFKVAIRLDQPHRSLRPGLSCTADITTATRTDVITIPLQALAIREFEVDPEGNPIESSKEDETSQGDDTSRRAQYADFEGVFTVVDEKAVFTRVSTGISGDTDIEVISGLEPGDIIITGSYRALRTLEDGDLVRVTNRGDRE